MHFFESFRESIYDHILSERGSPPRSFYVFEFGLKLCSPPRTKDTFHTFGEGAPDTQGAVDARVAEEEYAFAKKSSSLPL